MTLNIKGKNADTNADDHCEQTLMLFINFCQINVSNFPYFNNTMYNGTAKLITLRVTSNTRQNMNMTLTTFAEVRFIDFLNTVVAIDILVL